MPCGYCSETSKKVILMMLKITVELALIGAVASVFIIAAKGWNQELEAEQNSARNYMRMLNDAEAKRSNRISIANWNYESNITDYNEKIMGSVFVDGTEPFVRDSDLHWAGFLLIILSSIIELQVGLECAEAAKENWKETMTYMWHEFQDEDLKRMFKKFSILGTASLPEDLYQRLKQSVSNMKTTYAKATICDYKNKTKCDLHIDPDITDIFTKSRDAKELKHTWEEWHKAAGTPSKKDFMEYVALTSSAAKSNGFDTVAEWWLDDYEVGNIEDQFGKLWSTIKPFYQQLHAYVRRQLRLKYGDNVVSAKGPIPGHLLGNIWGQTWTHVDDFTKPYPKKTEVDFTSILVKQNYTALKFFKTAEQFFTSLNLLKMPDSFWEKSIIENPNDGRELVCHASAWDFFDGQDFRIKQCTRITSEFFKTTHHEMGHIQYFLQYADLPHVYKAGANPGFHEAVGDVMSLSVASPKHLKVLGLMEDSANDMESNINTLYQMALMKIAFLPYGYLLDNWRYSVFRGTTTPDNYNCHFWQMRETIQGIEPPVTRTEEDFDPAAKYHVSANVEYMRYYISFIIQFQFHRSLCKLAGQYSPGNNSQPLFNCDIYKSTAAGDAMAKMLRMGSSKPWPDAMEVLTGQREMDAEAILEYFQPLYEWLKTENERTGEYIGWEKSTVQFCTAQQLADLEDSDFKRKLQKQSGGSEPRHPRATQPAK